MIWVDLVRGVVILVVCFDHAVLTSSAAVEVPSFASEVGDFLAPIGMPLMMGLSLASTHIPGLSGRRIILLGEASYALYILHWPVWYLLARVSPIDLSRPANFWAWSLLYPVIVIPLSVLRFTDLETPVRRRIKSWHGSSSGSCPIGSPRGDRVIAT
jgi:peptidoglycan/LPS O-acetylase OafA/YrhL